MAPAISPSTIQAMIPIVPLLEDPASSAAADVARIAAFCLTLAARGHRARRQKNFPGRAQTCYVMQSIEQARVFDEWHAPNITCFPTGRGGGSIRGQGLPLSQQGNGAEGAIYTAYGPAASATRPRSWCMAPTAPGSAIGPMAAIPIRRRADQAALCECSRPGHWREINQALCDIGSPVRRGRDNRPRWIAGG